MLVKAKLVDFIESEHPVFLAIVQDMTNRKLAEYENAVNLERYRILEATSNAVTFEYDIPDDIMTFLYSGGKADSANRSISNYAEVSKRTKIVYPDDAAKFYAALKRQAKACKLYDARLQIHDNRSEQLPLGKDVLFKRSGCQWKGNKSSRKNTGYRR